MESRTVFGEICALCPLASRAQAELQNKQKNKWENRMSTNVNDRAIVKLNPSRFHDSKSAGRSSLLDWQVDTPLAPSMISPRCGSASRFRSIESPDKWVAPPTGCAPTCATARAASITCRVSRSPNLRRFRNNSAACTFRRRDTSYFLTENMFRDFATRSIRSGLSGFRSRATEPRALPLALRTSLNDTAKSLIHSSEWAMARSGYR